MSNLLESYRVLGVKVGASLVDVTASYRQLCREYHPDISDDPDAEEQMKQVNMAYTVLREKFKREASLRERQSSARAVRRYPTERPPVQRTEPKPPKTQEPQPQAQKDYTAQDKHRQTVEQATVSAEAEIYSRTVLHNYFEALNKYDYEKAYGYLSKHDKNNITLQSFAQWRESVAKLYPMREFKIAGGSSIAVVTWGGNRIFQARKFKVLITEDDYTASSTQSGQHDKLVIVEDGQWGVFLGYREVSELTRAFEKRFETKKKHDVEKRREEYIAGLDTEFDMFNMSGMRKAVSKELYRQRRYGCAMTFAAFSIKLPDDKNSGMVELLRSASKTINSALREIDIPAYAGDGVFAVMFIELGKKNAENIVSRLVENIKKNAGGLLSKNARIEYNFESWSENKYADIESINNVLQEFGKKI
ncbi:MAG: DnaJ domain-containing protein [Oscillospiraceae bacterium]|nr:DnaJ domain-containing protein [Oscillospiraceae bacterium]